MADAGRCRRDPGRGEAADDRGESHCPGILPTRSAPAKTCGRGTCTGRPRRRSTHGGEPIEPSPARLVIRSIIGGEPALYILDDRLRPVPPGVFGEVYIGGAGLANGYHGKPGLTADRFIPNPFSGRPGARLYRTGDIGRWRRSGRIELAGRADRQIKIRGYRIESGEVEAALRDHADITQAVVSLRGAGQDVLPGRLPGHRVGLRMPPRPGCAMTFARCFPTTWCRPPSWCCRSCRSPAAGRSTTARFPSRTGARPGRADGRAPGRRSSRASPRSSPNCSRCRHRSA